MDVAPEPVRVERLEVAAYTIPTEFPEADGTLSWDSTTIVIVQRTLAASKASVIPMVIKQWVS